MMENSLLREILKLFRMGWVSITFLLIYSIFILSFSMYATKFNSGSLFRLLDTWGSFDSTLFAGLAFGIGSSIIFFTNPGRFKINPYFASLIWIFTSTLTYLSVFLVSVLFAFFLLIFAIPASISLSALVLIFMFKFLCREKVNILGFSIVGLVLGFITILVYERGILYWSVFCNVVFGVSLVFASGNNNAVQSIYEFRFKHVIIPILFLSIIWFGSVHLMHLIHPLLS